MIGANVDVGSFHNMIEGKAKQASPKELTRGKSASTFVHTDMPPELQAHVEKLKLRSSISQS